MPQEINELYAFLSELPDGGQGVVGGRKPDGSTYPLIAAGLPQMQALVPFAQAIANLSDMDMVVVRFERAEHVMDVRAGEAEGDDGTLRDPSYQTTLSVDHQPPALEQGFHIRGLGEHE